MSATGENFKICATPRYIFLLDHPKPLLDHLGGSKTALARPALARPIFARPVLDRPLVWWSGKPNRGPEATVPVAAMRVTRRPYCIPIGGGGGGGAGAGAGVQLY